MGANILFLSYAHACERRIPRKIEIFRHFNVHNRHASFDLSTGDCLKIDLFSLMDNIGKKVACIRWMRENGLLRKVNTVKIANNGVHR
jgi:hypothetical protein